MSINVRASEIRHLPPQGAVLMIMSKCCRAKRIRMLTCIKVYSLVLPMSSLNSTCG